MASIRKLPSGHYRVRWRDAAGNEQGATAPTKKAALAVKAQAELDAFQGVHRDHKAGRQAFGPYLEEVLDNATDLRPATLERYRIHAVRYVIPALGGTAIASIGPGELRRFYGKLSKSVGTATVEAVHRLVSRTLSQAVADRIIQTNPARYAKAPRATRKPPVTLEPREAIWLATVLENRELFNPKRYYGPGADKGWTKAYKDAQAQVDGWQNQERARYDALATDTQCLEFYMEHPSSNGGNLGIMVLIGMFAGLRFGEAAALRVSNIQLGDEPKITVNEAATEVRGVVTIGPPKTPGSRRSIQIPTTLGKILGKAYIGAASGSLLFTTSTGKPLSRTRFAARIWNPAVKVARIEHHPTFHDLRHSYAAWQIAQNAGTKELQELMGHTSIRTTMDVYGHLMKSVESQQRARMDAALG